MKQPPRQLPTFKFTPAGFEQLKSELATLVERRPGVLTRLVAAREQGDLSENAGYHAAKEELGKIDSRIREIKLMMRLGEVTESKDVEIVGFGNVVVIRELVSRKLEINDGETDFEFTIVSAQEADPVNGKVSDSSPIGSALLGKRVGDNVEVFSPNGKAAYRIVEIKIVS
ncbi:MAG: transcription elongation factor GreA [Candidatus Curtissbacteria bacterium]